MFPANAMYGHKDRTIIIQSILWSRRKIVSCNTWSPSNCPMIRDLLDHIQQRHFSRAPILNIYNLGFKWIGTNFVNYSHLHCVSINLRSNSNCQTVPACCKSCKSYQRCSTEVNLIFKKIFQGELIKYTKMKLIFHKKNIYEFWLLRILWIHKRKGSRMFTSIFTRINANIWW